MYFSFYDIFDWHFASSMTMDAKKKNKWTLPYLLYTYFIFYLIFYLKFFLQRREKSMKCIFLFLSLSSSSTVLQLKYHVEKLQAIYFIYFLHNLWSIIKTFKTLNLLYIRTIIFRLLRLRKHRTSFHGSLSTFEKLPAKIQE